MQSTTNNVRQLGADGAGGTKSMTDHVIWRNAGRGGRGTVLWWSTFRFLNVTGTSTQVQTQAHRNKHKRTSTRTQTSPHTVQVCPTHMHTAHTKIKMKSRAHHCWKTLSRDFATLPVRIRRTESATPPAASLGTKPNLCDGNEPYHHRQPSSL